MHRIARAFRRDIFRAFSRRRRLVDGRVYEVVVEFAFAAFPIARSRSGERFARARSALRRLAKETWIGAPVRLAGRVLRRTR